MLAHVQDANRFVLNLLIAFLPAAILGLLFIKTIKQYLFHPVPVATAFIIGGILILWAERRKHVVDVERVEDMDWKHALKVGIDAVPGADTWYFTLGRNHYRRPVFWIVPQGSYRILLLSCNSDHVRRHVLRCLQKSRHSAISMMSACSAVGFVASFVSALVAVRGFTAFYQSS